MSEINNTAEVITENTESTEKKVPDAEEILRSTAKGKLELFAPIRARSRDVSVLEYDFLQLTGNEYAAAMDSDHNSRSTMSMTNKQAIALFAAAAAKCTPDIDATDIRERLNITDATVAIQLSFVFLRASNFAASRRITNA